MKLNASATFIFQPTLFRKVIKNVDSFPICEAIRKESMQVTNLASQDRRFIPPNNRTLNTDNDMPLATSADVKLCLPAKIDSRWA